MLITITFIWFIGFVITAIAQALAIPDWQKDFGRFMFCAAIWFIQIPALLLAGCVSWSIKQIDEKKKGG